MRRFWWLILFLLPTPTHASVFAKGRNFWVEAPTHACAMRVLHDAELYRQEFAAHWLGKTLPDWVVPVPILVALGPEAKGYHYAPLKIVSFIQLEAPTEAEAEAMLRHEVGHSVIHYDSGVEASRWLHEGVCVADEVLFGNYPTRYDDRVGSMPLSAYLPAEGIIPIMSGDAFYGQAASLVLYIRHRRGPAGVWEFYRLGRRRGWEAASIGVFHQPLPMLEKELFEWRYELESPYPRSVRATR